MTNAAVIEGNCLTRLAEMGRQSIHMVLTDPPYFLDGLDDAWRKGEMASTGAVGALPPGMKFDARQGQ